MELLSGTGSVGTACKEHDCEVVSLGRVTPANIRAGIMDWDYKVFLPRHFDFIWASPPCTEYSVAKTIGHRDIEGFGRVVARTIEIIRHLGPKYWVMENPQTSRLKEQAIVAPLAFDDVD